MNSDQLLKIVEQYSRKNDSGFDDIKVTRVPDHTTVFVEHIGTDGRAVIMTEIKVDGITYWAGFSMRSQTVFVSLAN